MEHIVYTCNVSFVELKILTLIVALCPFFTKKIQKIYIIFLSVLLNSVKKAVEYIIKGIKKKIKKFFHGFGKLVVWGQLFLYALKSGLSFRQKLTFLLILTNIVSRYFH